MSCPASIARKRDVREFVASAYEHPGEIPTVTHRLGPLPLAKLALREAGDDRYYGVSTTRPVILPSRRSFSVLFASESGRFWYGIGSTLPARTSSIISLVSFSEPTIEPPMEMVRKGNIGSGSCIWPPNRPTMMILPPRRTVFIA